MVSPPPFSNHSSVDTPLDYFPFLQKYKFYMFHRHFTFKHVLEVFPSKSGSLPAPCASQTPGSRPDCLSKASTDIPGIHFLPPVIPVSSPTSSCLSPAPTSHQAADRPYHSALPFRGSHGSWGKDTSSHHGRSGLTRGGPCRRPSLTYNVPTGHRPQHQQLPLPGALHLLLHTYCLVHAPSPSSCQIKGHLREVSLKTLNDVYVVWAFFLESLLPL